jgi:hypothetical protein
VAGYDLHGLVPWTSLTARLRACQCCIDHVPLFETGGATNLLSGKGPLYTLSILCDIYGQHVYSVQNPWRALTEDGSSSIAASDFS